MPLERLIGILTLTMKSWICISLIIIICNSIVHSPSLEIHCDNWWMNSLVLNLKVRYHVGFEVFTVVCGVLLSSGM
jgi:hypothetical protein